VALPLHNSFGFQLSLCACREEQFWNLLNDPRTHEPSLGECIKTYLVYPNLRGSFPSYICTVWRKWTRCVDNCAHSHSRATVPECIEIGHVICSSVT